MKRLRDYQVGEPLPVRKWVPTVMQLRQYAEASGDFNPIHLDDTYARQAGLDGVIAHGMLTMAQVGALLTDWMGAEGTLKDFEVKFQKMVHPGDHITCSGSVKEILNDCLVCDLVAKNSLEETVLSGSAVVKVHAQ